MDLNSEMDEATQRKVDALFERAHNFMMRYCIEMEGWTTELRTTTLPKREKAPSRDTSE